MNQLKLPKISIVSPSYNQGAFIEDAIKSVLNQDYKNFEHIIIDGGSKDNTVEILKKYPHLIWVSEKDEGQSDAINKGFNKVSGDIIGWLNTDDYYLPGTFKIILDSFKNKKYDVVYGDIQFVDKDKQFTRKVLSRVPVKWLMLFHCYIHSASFFFKKEILDSGIRIDPKIHITMDKDFFAHIFYKGYKFKYINKVLTSFRWHDCNKSIDTSDVKQIRYKEGLDILNKYAKLNIPSNNLTIALYSFAQKSLYPFKKILKWYTIYIVK